MKRGLESLVRSWIGVGSRVFASGRAETKSKVDNTAGKKKEKAKRRKGEEKKNKSLSINNNSKKIHFVKVLHLP